MSDDARTVEVVTDGVSNRIHVAPAGLSYGASKTVASAGTAEALGSSTACRSVIIVAKSTNTGNVYIGSSNVSSTLKIKSLAAGDMIELSVYDVSTIYLDVDTNAEGVDYWLTN